MGNRSVRRGRSPGSPQDRRLNAGQQTESSGQPAPHWAWTWPRRGAEQGAATLAYRRPHSMGARPQGANLHLIGKWPQAASDTVLTLTPAQAHWPSARLGGHYGPSNSTMLSRCATRKPVALRRHSPRNAKR